MVTYHVTSINRNMLQGVLEKHNIDVPLCKLGPKVVVIHETQYTDTLDSNSETVNSFELNINNVFSLIYSKIQVVRS